MRTLGLIALLALTQDSDLLRDYSRARSGSNLAMVTLIAVYEDGRPHRGYIRCEGSWYKHADREEETAYGNALPFKTDSRGAVIMNPHIEDEWIFCFVQERGYYGQVRVDFSEDAPRLVREIIVRKDS